MEVKNKNDDIKIQITDFKTKEIIQKIVENGQEEGFFICDVSDITDKHHKWIRAIPRVKPFYAVKANDIRVVLETLATLGTGFDCASPGEIMKILSLGVPPEDIIFANPTKTMSQIKYAYKVGVAKMTFDNEDELYKIKDVYPDAELVLRIRFDDPKATYNLGKKYGADPNTEVVKLLTLAKTLKLNVIGVTFHIGSGAKNWTTFRNAIAVAKKVFNVGLKCGYLFNLLDIGGGFPGDRSNIIFKIGEVINEALDKYFPDHSIQVIAEPGRYFVDSAFTLAASIHTTKTIIQTDERGKDKISKGYYSNQSVFQALPAVLYGEVYVPSILFDKPQRPIYPSIVWGSTLDVLDRLSNTTDLHELKNGDWVYFENAGAYSICCSCQFNGFPTTPVHNIIQKQDWLILTKERCNVMPNERFVQGNDLKHLRTGLMSTYDIQSQYF